MTMRPSNLTNFTIDFAAIIVMNPLFLSSPFTEGLANCWSLFFYTKYSNKGSEFKKMLNSCDNK